MCVGEWRVLHFTCTNYFDIGTSQMCRLAEVFHASADAHAIEHGRHKLHTCTWRPVWFCMHAHRQDVRQRARPVGMPVGASTGKCSITGRVWTVEPQSLLSVARPRAHVYASPEWVHREVPSDHSPLAVVWPSAAPPYRRPVPRQVAEDPAMAEVVGCVRAAAQLDGLCFVGDVGAGWRQHKAILRKASCVVRDRTFIAGGRHAGAEAQHARVLPLANSDGASMKLLWRTSTFMSIGTPARRSFWIRRSSRNTWPSQ